MKFNKWTGRWAWQTPQIIYTFNQGNELVNLPVYIEYVDSCDEHADSEYEFNNLDAFSHSNQLKNHTPSLYVVIILGACTKRLHLEQKLIKLINKLLISHRAFIMQAKRSRFTNVWFQIDLCL